MAPSPPSLSEAAEALRRRVARQVILASLICAGIAGLGFTVGLWFSWADAGLWSGGGLVGVAGCVVALGASWALLQRGRRVAATRLAATAMNVVVLASVAWFGGTHTVAAAYLSALVGITALLVGPRGGAASLASCMAFLAVDYTWGPLRPESLHLNPGERLIDWWLGIGIAGTFMVLAMRHYEGFLVRAVEQEMRAREALSARKRADRFRSQLFAHSPSPVLLFDADGALFEANQAAQDLLGDAPIGTPLAELLDWNEGQAVGAVISVDPHVPVEVRSAKVPDPDGDLCAIFALRDLRPQRLAEAQQRQAVLHAEASNRAKSSFLASVSHELRTPLNAILGYGEMLEEDIEDDGHQEDLGRILASGRHLLTLIDDVLDLSHVESGQLDIGSERVDLGAVLRDTEAMCRPMLRRRGHTLHIDVAGDLPGAWATTGGCSRCWRTSSATPPSTPTAARSA